jgi:BirA family biotin operon repressor/biotin-[acetyl-CoA-carboxylase] ligase
MNNCFFSVIKHFCSIDSTNIELLNNEYKDKTLIYTYNQIKGRGRFNRRWITFKDKAVALSFLLKSERKDKNQKYCIKNNFLINMILSVSLVDLLKNKYAIDCWIKWPNDIYIKDKKLAGVLAETKFINKDNFKIVGGIGINVNVNEKDAENIDKKATSISIEKGFEINLNDFTNSFIDELSVNLFSLFSDEINNIKITNKMTNNISDNMSDNVLDNISDNMSNDISDNISDNISDDISDNISEYKENTKNINQIIEKKVKEEKIAGLKKKWLEYCNILGRYVIISNSTKDLDSTFIKGKVIDIDDEGFLIVETENKKIKVLNGDLSIVME